MKLSGTCVVGFAGIQAGITWSGRRSLAMLKFLYKGVAISWSQEPPASRFRLKINETDGFIFLYRDEQLLYQGIDEGEAAGILLDWTVHDLADVCRFGPLFHAAALSCRREGILLPGLSNSGKTTLAAWLTGRGYHYLTDELACIESGTLNLSGFYRPLHLRMPAPAEITPGIFPEPGSLPMANQKVYRSNRGLLLQANHINPNNRYHTPKIRVIVFPQYLANAKTCLTPLSKAKACLHLMGSLVNARNLLGHGMAEISHLARTIPAYTLTYGHLAQIEDRIDSLMP